MSFAQTFNVFQTSSLTSGQKLVLAGIATFADDAGKCWPSIATIAERCSMAVRSVQRHIAQLVRLGYLERIYRSGHAAITRLRMTPAKVSPPPLPICHPESVIESVIIKTALPQPAAPKPDQAAVASVVVFESTDTKQPPANELVMTDLSAKPEPTDPLADVPATLLADFGVVRKAKKKSATVTKTEAVVFAAEAQKAGMTVAQAITTCVLRGWSRFEAAWIPQQAPAEPPQRYFVPETVQPASPAVVAAGRAALAALRDKITKQAKPKGYSVLT